MSKCYSTVGRYQYRDINIGAHVITTPGQTWKQVLAPTPPVPLLSPVADDKSLETCGRLRDSWKPPELLGVPFSQS